MLNQGKCVNKVAHFVTRRPQLHHKNSAHFKCCNFCSMLVFGRYGLNGDVANDPP